MFEINGLEGQRCPTLSQEIDNSLILTRLGVCTNDRGIKESQATGSRESASQHPLAINLDLEERGDTDECDRT